MKVAIIGAGISGLSLGNMLREDDHEVIIFEQKSNAGGLIACERVNDCLFHKVGGHVFNSKNSEVLKWFWRHFDRDNEFVQAKRNARVFINGKIIGYPIENNVYALGSENAEQIIRELLFLHKTNIHKEKKQHDFETFLKSNFGETLFNLYFGPYNYKLWNTDLSQVSLDWLEGKLPMPDYEDIILSNILRKEEAEMVHSTFYYPKSGGSQFIVDRLAKDLNIVTDCKVDAITREGDSYTIGTERGFDKVIWCGNVKTLPSLMLSYLKEAEIDTDKIQGLHANGTSNLFCETDSSDISWLYIPESFTKAHRIIYTGNFSETNNRGSSRSTCVVEFSGKVDFNTMVTEAAKLPGNLSPLSSNYESASYVVQDHDTRPLISKIKQVLAPQGFYLLGRFAEWEYYNMDKCIEAGMQLVKSLKAK